ncbi:MAG: hypothetical protein GXO39_02090 [Thermotogae bacterium]|nr:hypothetical protein [Thermotogota bacterium]
MLAIQSWEVKGGKGKVKPSPEVNALLQHKKLLYSAFLSLAKAFLKEPTGRWLRKNVEALISLKVAYTYLLSALEKEGERIGPWEESEDDLIRRVRDLDRFLSNSHLLDYIASTEFGEDFWKDLMETTAIVSFLVNVILSIRQGKIKGTRKAYQKTRGLLRRYLGRLEDLLWDVWALKEMEEEEDEEVDIENIKREMDRLIHELESE